MIELLRSWLLSITVTALIAAVADRLTPDGAVKKVGKMAGGLLMLFSFLQPITSLDNDMLSSILSQYRFQTKEYIASVETGNIQLMKYIIEEETSAYIQDKAKELDLICETEVKCRVNDENIPYPVSVTVFGDLTDEEKLLLSRMIESELAIDAENQCYERENGL